MAGRVTRRPEAGSVVGAGRGLRFFRLAVRLAGFVGIVAGASGDYLIRVLAGGGRSGVRSRGEWLTRWSRRTLRVIHVQLQFSGAPPSGGLLVANHLTYLDILVLAAAHPMVFVAKSEVRAWPVFGWLARMGGTLFVRRDHRGDVSRVNAELAAAVAAGSVVVVFPEGTSSDGHEVLPFRSSLLAPAAAGAWPVTPAWIGYEMPEGSVEDEVCYWRDMVFLPHFLNLLSQPRINATIRFGRTVVAGTDRKRVALELHDAVVGLRVSPVAPTIPVPPERNRPSGSVVEAVTQG